MTLLACVVGFACDGGHSPSSAAGSGPLAVAPQDVHLLGTSEAIAQVTDLDVSADGTVWVLNSLAPFFIGFDAEGSVVETFGEEGGGPAQYRMPAAFVSGGIDGEVWVLDVLRHVFIRTSDPEAGWSQLSLPTDAIPPGSLRGGMNLTTTTVRTARLGDEIIVPRTTGSLDSGIFAFKMAILGADLVAFDPETGSVRDVLSLRETLDDPLVGFEPTEGGLPLWYRLWAVCAEDRLVVYDRTRNQLRVFTGAGAELDPVDLPPVRFTTVTPRQFAGSVFELRQAEVTGGVGARLGPADSARIMNEMIREITGSPEQLAAYLPRFVDFRCTEDGTMWMHPLDLDVGGLSGGPLWFEIDPAGKTREVTLPRRFDAVRFTADRIWGVQRDELDVASVAWIAVERAGGVSESPSERDEP